MSKIKVGILGGAGYTGGELIRLLLHHPFVEISFVHSRSKSGQALYEVHHDLLGDTELRFSATMADHADLVFLCLAHGESKNMISQIKEGVRIIDLSQDHRIASHAQHRFIYGLTELNRSLIAGALKVANPGCFATAIQLALLPLAKENLLNSEIWVSCTTGSTGAGQGFSETSHYSWRNNNHSVYKAFTHQHLAEIKQSIQQLQFNFDKNIQIFPQRGAFARGIFACLHLKIEEELNGIITLFENYYASHPFVFVSKKSTDLKQVVNTNKCILYLEKHNNELMIVSCIDNLLKGASGQAIQNMNLMFGFDECTGLKLKASAY